MLQESPLLSSTPLTSTQPMSASVTQVNLCLVTGSWKNIAARNRTKTGDMASNTAESARDPFVTEIL